MFLVSVGPIDRPDFHPISGRHQELNRANHNAKLLGLGLGPWAGR